MELSSKLKWKNRETLSRAATMALLGCSWQTLQGWIDEGAPCSSTGTGGSKVWNFHIGRLAAWFRKREHAKFLSARAEGKKYRTRRICLCCGHLKKTAELHPGDLEICVPCDVKLKKHYAEIGITDDMDEAA